MQLWNVAYEAHRYGATLYLTGMLTGAAATEADETLNAMPDWIRSVRVDMRAVELLDPTAFVELARALNRWRDTRHGKVALEFPARSSQRRSSGLRLVRDPVICPVSRSDGYAGAQW